MGPRILFCNAKLVFLNYSYKFFCIFVASFKISRYLKDFCQAFYYVKMKDTLKKLREALRPIYGERETEAIIRILFHYLKNWDTTDILIHQDEELSPYIKEETDKILKRLLVHEPIQYITGEARFHGMEFHVTPDVLIPRPETDELVDLIIKDAGDREDLYVLDIGTGSGCIAISLARSLKFPHITATDISEKALEVAKENAKRLKVKVNFIHEDIFLKTPLGKFDIIVSNPPYIDESEKKSMEKNVLMYEPHNALFVSDDNPLVFYKRIAEIALASLRNNGSLYLEINPRHGEELCEMLKNKGFKNIEMIRDFYGKYSFIKSNI